MPIRACLLALVLVALSVGARAQSAAPEGYRVIDPPQPTASPGRIEVTEFFSYGCPHCNEFYPLLNAWVKQLPDDVAFKRVPVGFGRREWNTLVKAYYALEATGDGIRLDGAIFHAIHEERLPLFDPQNFARWVGQQGGDPERFLAAFNSPDVNERLSRSDQMVQDYRIQGVPGLVVGGKYLALGSSFEEILANADTLIRKVRGENAAARPSKGGARSARPQALPKKAN